MERSTRWLLICGQVLLARTQHGIDRCDHRGGDMAKAEQKAQEMFVRYSDEAETIQRGEAETLEQIAATLLDIAKRVESGSVIRCAPFTRRVTVY
jgi:hypothetical protein